MPSGPRQGAKLVARGGARNERNPWKRPTMSVVSDAPWKGASEAGRWCVIAYTGIAGLLAPLQGANLIGTINGTIPGVPLRSTPGYPLASLRLARPAFTAKEVVMGEAIGVSPASGPICSFDPMSIGHDARIRAASRLSPRQGAKRVARGGARNERNPWKGAPTSAISIAPWKGASEVGAQRRVQSAGYSGLLAPLQGAPQ